MKLEMHAVPEMTIEEFAELHNLTMDVTERGTEDIEFCRKCHGGTAWRYYAEFRHCEILDGHFLLSVCGNGNTPEKAMRDYARRISEQRLVIGAYIPKRKEIDVPRLVTANQRDNEEAAYQNNLVNQER